VIPVLTSRYDTDGGLAFDRMTVTGSVDIQGGGLGLVPTDDTTPAPALYDSALVIDAAGGATGAFDTVDAPDFGDGSTLAVTYDADGVRATRAYRGDATLNGGVGLKDFIITANNRGTEGTWVDGNYDNGLGDVNDNDLNTTAAAFGTGPADGFDGLDDLFSLIVDIETGQLTLNGTGSLRAFYIASDSGSLDVSNQTEAFEYSLLSSAFGVARGDADDGVDVQGSFYELSERYDWQEGIEDLVFGYGLTTSDSYLQGSVSYRGGNPPTPDPNPTPIPAPTAAFAGLALMGLSMTRRRRRRAR